jgi:phosphoribosylformimino-5-aminoimidazole carboxamide ribonucleotide (ProFAR) isomerase
MKIQVSLETEGQEPRVVRISPMAIIGWERETGHKISDLANGLALTDVATMTYVQVRLEGQVDMSLSQEDWLRSVVSLDPVVDSPAQPGEAPSDAS